MHAVVALCPCSSVAFHGFDELLLLLQVDVIVSEWMGYALLFESMLDTVLYARDRLASTPAECSSGLFLQHFLRCREHTVQSDACCVSCRPIVLA